MNYHIYTTINKVPLKEWETLSNQQSFFLSKDFLQPIEQLHKNEISPLYIIIKDQDKTLGILYAQNVRLNSSKIKDYILGSNPKTTQLDKIKIALSNLVNVKVCFLGNLFLSNEISYKFLHNFSHDNIPNLLNQIQNETKVKLIMIPEYFTPLLSNKTKKQKPMLVEPNMVLSINNNWSSFDDYLQALSKKYRKRYKNTIKKNTPISKRLLDLNEIKKHQNELKKLFENVYYKSSFSAAKFNTDTLQHFKQLKMKVFGYFFEEKLVGFSSILSKEKTLYAHYIGLDYSFNRQYDIYSTMLYNKIQYAIENNLDTIKFGRTASEFKSNFGALPKKNNALIYDYKGCTLFLLSPLLPFLKPKEWVLRKPFKDKPIFK